MRHQFFRFFISIFLISLAVIIVQCCVIFIGNMRIMLGWKDLVFQEFASSVRSSIEGLQDTDSSSVMNLMVSRTSERISGLLFRDKDGRYVLSLGASSAGEQLPSPEARRSMLSAAPSGRLKLMYQNSISYIDINIPAPKYCISITTIPGTGFPAGISFDEMSDGEDMLVSLPSIVADQDIAGTIMIKVDGEPSGYIDVLVYRMDYYAPTMFAISNLFGAFVISLPLSLLISAVLAAIVSRKNEKSVKEIRNSLSRLSLGYFDVSLPRQSTEEMQQIADSITTLGKDLSRHQKSRKEWIRNISHDLNTPVTSINLLVTGALDGMFPLDRDLLSNLKKETDVLMSRIQSVAQYSYLLSPDAKAEPAEVSLIETADSVLQSEKMNAVVPSDDTLVYADPKLLEKALHEVFSNARSYGSGENPPRLSCRKENGCTVIEVVNDGHLPSPLPQFFEPWARGDASRTAGGSGLGLPIVYQIMELHGGKVSIGENNGKVCVTLSFPDKSA